MHPHHNLTFDLGNIEKDTLINNVINFENIFNKPYNIRKITPYCPCIKIKTYTEEAVYPQSVDIKNDSKEKDIEEELKLWTIEYTIMKRHLGQSSTNIEVILESLFDTDRFIIININYNVITKI